MTWLTPSAAILYGQPSFLLHPGGCSVYCKYLKVIVRKWKNFMFTLIYKKIYLKHLYEFILKTLWYLLWHFEHPSPDTYSHITMDLWQKNKLWLLRCTEHLQTPGDISCWDLSASEILAFVYRLPQAQSFFNEQLAFRCTLMR